ncbi:MAG: PEP-CTERM sorting domain-containing protein [Pirellulales bacterium]|nr:PEP-CTERM sorting domain-containing protein [Pirellulales bacterium]
MNRSFAIVLWCWTTFMVAPLWLASSRPANASLVYSNDFESNTTGFTNAGVLPALTRTNLPTDGGGLASPNQSQWLGRLGHNIAKSTANKEIVNLSVAGLTPGQSYIVAFDLLIGASWDGAANGYGTDAWYFSVNGTRLVDTMFSNGDQGRDYGAYSPQRYSDTHFADPNLPDVAAFTGAEFSRREGPGYSGYYGIYYFSRGANNPTLTFTATASTATLEWARFSGGVNFGDSGDEYWALDNVAVTLVPEPSSVALLASTLVVFGGICLRRRRRVVVS